MRVDLGDRSYDIKIGSNWLPELIDQLHFIPKTSPVMLITDENVNRLTGDRVMNLLHQADFQVYKSVIPGGEGCKNLATTAGLYERMIELGLDRKSTVLALGGGIVGDIAGFVAATYMRGLTYVQIPTTLLAQVDSSVGGKTGVNLAEGKNLVGAFHQPALVFIDVDFIKSLPEREYLTGLAEVIKYGLIRDEGFFSYLENNLPRIQARNTQCLQYIVHRCCSTKAEIVGADETEQGLRALLNLGHTFGHAFENLTHYRQFTHGEAVGIGMIYAARLAHNLNKLSRADLTRVESLITGFGLPISYGNLAGADILAQMQRDKKNTGGKMRLVLPTGLGTSQIYDDVSTAKVAAILT